MLTYDAFGYDDSGMFGESRMFGMFDMFSVMFFLTFLMIIGVFAFIIIKNVSMWNKNNHSPRLTVDATVRAKRSEVHRRSSVNHVGTTTSTKYYVTFEIASSGDRLELSMPGQQYGLLLEDDYGKLTFQGIRFISFDRTYQ